MAKTENLKPWKPGQSGNPKGRPKGSRHKLNEDFWSALSEDFAEHGVAVVARVRKEDPSTYLKLAATAAPKEMRHSIAMDAAQLTDEELARIIVEAGSRIGAAEAENDTGLTH